MVARSAGAGSRRGLQLHGQRLHRNYPGLDGGGPQWRATWWARTTCCSRATCRSITTRTTRWGSAHRDDGVPQSPDRPPPRLTRALDNVRAVGLMFGSWWHTFVGNVLGEPGAMDGWIYEDPGDGTYGHATSKWGKRSAIWKLGYAPGALGAGRRPQGAEHGRPRRELRLSHATPCDGTSAPQGTAELALSHGEAGVLRRPARGRGWTRPGRPRCGRSRRACASRAFCPRP